MTRAGDCGTGFGTLAMRIALVFLFALGALLAACIAIARVNIERELGSRAQETATGLAKALEGAMHDRALVDALVTALFDRGHCASITVVASDGRTLAYKALPAEVPGVPQWFATAAALDTPASEAMVTQRWRPLGRVIVVSHPQYAYRQLWHTALAIVLAMLGTYAATLALLHRARGTAATPCPAPTPARSSDLPSFSTVR